MDKTIHEKIEALSRRIQELAQQQTNISNQLLQLINELQVLKQEANTSGTVVPEQVEQTDVKTIEVREVIEAPRHRPVPPPPAQRKAAPVPSSRSSTSFEEFIGKNVASKVGILVTIIGIFIGAKYAIDHNMVSPVIRVLAGYVCGVALIAVAARLKNKYEAYSSVLMGGGLAVLYFITYIAYSFYGLMPQVAAFALMLVFTAGTVYAALLYNRVIIAHIAQVGAYAIPFLLSDNSGRYAVFFGYIAIINTGILVVSLRKYWKSLFYSAFALTWFIYIFWYFFSYQAQAHTYIAWTYLGIFFLIFYATFLAYKIIKKERYELHDVFVLLGNAFIFYGIGYGLLNKGSNANYYGIFTLINAAIHLTVSQAIRRLQLADRSLYYLVLGLVIVFCTIAIPVQLDGNWVTLLWTAEAVLVFLIGRMRQAPAYEKLGVGLAMLSFLSLAQDWFNQATAFTFPDNTPVQPFINVVFATGLLVAVAQGTMIFYNRNKKYQSELPAASLYLSFYNYVLPALLLVTSYFVFNIEITGYFRKLELPGHEYEGFYGLWESRTGLIGFNVLFLYTMAFNIVLMIVNNRWVRNKHLGALALIGITLMMIVLLTEALPVLNEMTRLYFQKGWGYFGVLEFVIRYIVIAVTTIMLFNGQQTLHAYIQDLTIKKGYTLMVYTIVLSFISAEYLCWTGIDGEGKQYKLGLSIIWGIYALALVVLGIRKKQKHLRLAGIVLFLVTLLKLFLYDLAGSGTITKTVSFISLGVLLLVVSFLYNKYKDVLFGELDRAGDNTGNI
ncbi:MAG TPA: DUF2339 domain-containing protein [Niastella sp.]